MRKDQRSPLLALTCRVTEAVQHGESAVYFAVGSLCFSWLFRRGPLIPTALAQLGVIASALLVVVLPLQLAGLLGESMSWASSVTWLVWLPLLVFEVTVALWLIVRGVALSTAQDRRTQEADRAGKAVSSKSI